MFQGGRVRKQNLNNTWNIFWINNEYLNIPLFGGVETKISNRNKIGKSGGERQPNLPTVGGHRTKRENEWWAALTPYGRWFTTELKQPFASVLKKQTNWRFLKGSCPLDDKNMPLKMANIFVNPWLLTLSELVFFYPT